MSYLRDGLAYCFEIRFLVSSQTAGSGAEPLPDAFVETIRLLKNSYIRRHSERLSEAKNSRTMAISSKLFPVRGIDSFRQKKQL
jgi:hypothetical protein